MFKIKNKKDIYFKNIYLYSIGKNDIDLLCAESSLKNDNFSLRNSKHIYGSGAKILRHKIEYKGDCILLKMESYNKKYDNTYMSELHILRTENSGFTLFAY